MGMHRGIGLVTVAAVVLLSTACAGSDTSTTGQSVPSAETPPSVSATVTPPTRTATTLPPTTEPPQTTPAGNASVVPDEPDHSTPAESETPTEPPSGGAALAALAPFFAAVAQTDQNLVAAAEVINAGIGSGTITVDRATIEAIDRGSPYTVAATIPTGLDPTVERAVLLVYSDVVSRYGAMRGGDCVEVGTRPLADLNADCFVRGHEPSIRMPGDVEAAHAAAAAAPGTVTPDPASRDSAELPLRIEYINKANMGCGTMGGYLAAEAIPVVWVTEGSGSPEVPPTDGRVGGIAFTASYDAGSGWTVDLRAC